MVSLAKDKEKDLKKEGLKARFVSMAHILWGRDISELTSHEIYTTIASTLKQNITENWIKTNKAYMERQEKQIYYFSIEFLLGRLLNTNLINLGERDKARFSFWRGRTMFTTDQIANRHIAKIG